MNIRTKANLKAVAAAICAGAAAAGVYAAPLQKEHVASSAKWLLHLDTEIFRAGKVGAFVSKQIVDKKFMEFESAAKLDLDFDFNKVTSITAYSTDFEKDTGVLIVRSSADVKKDIQTVIDRANKEGKPQDLTKVDTDYALYNFKGEAFVAPDVTGMTIFSKSRSQLEAARAIIMKKGESLAQKDNFAKANTSPNHYLVAMVQGLSDEAKVPPNAQILKQASSGAFFIGESEDKTVAQVVLRGKNAEAANQITQVIQGLIALVNLNQDSDEKIRQLTQAASVKNEGEQVTIQVALPSAKIIDEIAKKEGITQ